MLLYSTFEVRTALKTKQFPSIVNRAPQFQIVLPLSSLTDYSEFQFHSKYSSSWPLNSDSFFAFTTLIRRKLPLRTSWAEFILNSMVRRCRLSLLTFNNIRFFAVSDICIESKIDSNQRLLPNDEDQLICKWPLICKLLFSVTQLTF